MFNNLVRQRLIGLVGGMGASIVSNPHQLEGRLADLAATSPQEVLLIMQAANAGIPEEIATSAPEHRDLVVKQASDWMASEPGTAPEGARWAVEAWAAALKDIQITPRSQDAGTVEPAPILLPPLQPPLPPPPVAPQGWQPAPWDTPLAPRPAAWPQPPAIQQPDYGADTSGMKGEVPPDIAKLKWNWGAFGVPFFWLIAHNLWPVALAYLFSGCFTFPLTFALSLLPGGRWLSMLPQFAFTVYMGLMGHKIAWRNRIFSSQQQYLEVQTIWTYWGIGLTVFSIVFMIVFQVLMASHPFSPMGAFPHRPEGP